MWSQMVTPDTETNETQKREEHMVLSSDSDESINYEETARMKITKRIKITKDEEESQFFGWSEDTQKDYVSKIIQRFRLRKLKSPNGVRNTFYFDNVLYFIWQYKRVGNTDTLIRPTDEMYQAVQLANNITFQPYLEQPVEFW